MGMWRNRKWTGLRCAPVGALGRFGLTQNLLCDVEAALATVYWVLLYAYTRQIQVTQVGTNIQQKSVASSPSSIQAQQHHEGWLRYIDAALSLSFPLEGR
jgi:hypothetical protein